MGGIIRVGLALPLAGAALSGCIPQAVVPSRGYDRARVPVAAPRAYRDVPALAAPAPLPAWEARPVTPDAQIVPTGFYTVAPGDTLRGIAIRTGAGSEAIARANALSRPFTIHTGQRLAIPGGRYHRVREGETGIAIAQAYGVDWSGVVALNELEEPYILRTGQRILIPDQGSAAPGMPVAAPTETLEARAARFHLDIDDLVTGSQPALAANQRPAAPSASPARVLPATAAVAEPARLRGGFGWPVHGTVVTRFGPVATGQRSDGIQIAVPLDTPVLAAADGVVAYVGSDIPALGGLVILKHGDGWTTVYGHAAQLLVQRGQSVKRGQTIALSGSSGNADRPELHFEIREGRDPVDPLARLPRG